MVKKSVLGKGMESLLQTNAVREGTLEKATRGTKGKSAPLDEGTPYLVDVKSIKPNLYQPRRHFDETALKELADSIRENGILSPLLVTKTEDGLELIAGERRLRAAKIANLKKVPVLIKRSTDREKLMMAIVENVQRDDLNCVEEALGYFRLIEEFKLTQEDVAKQVGKNRSTVTNLLRILKLPKKTTQLLREDKISLGHAKSLLALKSKELIDQLALECIEQGWSVRELERQISRQLKGDDSSSKKKIIGDGSPFQTKLDRLSIKLERRSGLPFKISSNSSGKGKVFIEFASEAEFNDIYEYLLR